MGIRYYDGKILFDGGTIAYSDDCCCEEPLPSLDCCSGPGAGVLTLTAAGWARNDPPFNNCLAGANGTFVLTLAGGIVGSAQYRSVEFCLGDTNTAGYVWAVTLCALVTGSYRMRVQILPQAPRDPFEDSISYQREHVHTGFDCDSFIENPFASVGLNVINNGWTAGTLSISSP